MTADGALAPALILFGAPGSGKGTQAKSMRAFLDVPHISTGDMLREHIRKEDALGNQIQDLIDAGKLVPDELANRMVEERLRKGDCQRGVILDGYPRTLNQSEALMSLMQAYGLRPIVVYLKVDYEVIVTRLSGRRQCSVCGSLYSLATNPPKVAGICDLEGAALVTREDDRPEVVRARLKEYEKQTQPILEALRKTGVPVFEIDGTHASPVQISRQVFNDLDSMGMLRAAASASRRQGINAS
jgi:adenylate kinase